MGQVVSFDGNVNFWFGQWQLENYGNLEAIDQDVPAPTPVVADPDTVASGGSLAEPYESIVVSVLDVEVLEHDPPAGPGDEDPTGAFVVTGGLRVNNFLTDLEPRPLIGDRVDVTGILRFSNDDSKLEPRSPDDVGLVLIGPPEIGDFGPSEVFLVEGDVGASTLPPLFLTLDRPAPAGGTEVTIENWGDGAVGSPATVTVPEGETTVELWIARTRALSAPRPSA